MTVRLTSDDIEALLDQAISHIPPTRNDQHQQQMEQATEAALRTLAEPLMNGDAPDLMVCEERIMEALGQDAVPPWLVRSRVVLVFRDVMRDPDYRRAFDALSRTERDTVLESWARLAGDLFVSYPDKQISGRPDLALSILSGDDRDLKHYLAIELGEAQQAQPRQAGFLSRLTGRKTASRPTETPHQQPSLRQSPAAPQTATLKRSASAPSRPHAAAPATSRFIPQQGIKRVSGAQRLAMTVPQRPNPLAAKGSTPEQRTAASRPAPSAPVAESTMAKPAPRLQNDKMGPESFIGKIQEQFNQRGLPPISVGIATEAARMMTQTVLHGRVPDFHEVEYEVMLRQGEGVAAGAVRTWTIHAFMECMRDPWFRDRYNALPSQARSEAVWTWAKLAADWFDVPDKMREFWVRSLSGGDAVLAAAVSRAFAAKTPTAPMKSTRAMTMPPAINQLVEELEQREAMLPAEADQATEFVPMQSMNPGINVEVMAPAPVQWQQPSRPATPAVGMVGTFGIQQSFDRRTPRAETSLSFPRPLNGQLNGQRLRVMAPVDAATPGNLPLGAAEIRYGSPE